jgi:electron transport complex protein RnfE
MKATNEYLTIARDGLWNSNPALVQLLGLCPLMAVTNSTVNGLGMGLATAATFVISNGLVSVIRNWVTPEIRVPVFMLVIACVVTVIQLFMNAFVHELYTVLGIFLALIVTNCNVLARAEYAARNRVPIAMFDGFMMGLGFALVLTVMGAMREMLGSGTLFANAHMMFGEGARSLTIKLGDYHGMLLGILAPGGFMALGILIALKNYIDRYRKANKAVSIAAPASNHTRSDLRGVQVPTQ